MADSLLQEVDDDVRRARMQALWNQYRKPALFALILLIVATTGASLWKDYQEKKAGEAMLILDQGITAYEAGDHARAQRHFSAMAEQTDGELNDLARLWHARALASDGHAADAIRILTELAKNPHGKDFIWRDMACLRLMGANAEVPEICATTGDSPLKTTRLEWQAAQLWQQGKAEEARTLMQAVAADETAPQDQRDRARNMLSALSAEAK